MLLANFLVLILIEARALALEAMLNSCLSKTKLILENSM